MRSQSVCAIAAAVALMCAAVATAQGNCRVALTTPDGVRATYDLTNLKSQTPTGWFAEDDSDPFGEKVDFYYWYEFCDALPARPTTNPPNKCANVTSTGLTIPVGNFYQIYNSTTTHLDTNCHMISQANNLTWDFIDPLNPAVGVVQHYGNGDLCGTNGAREITISVFCKPHGQEPVLGVVSEPVSSSCDYELTVTSINACPLECPIVNEALCGGHGVCGPDNDINAVRCFCNTGFSGADCTTPATDDSGGGGGGSHATSVLVAFVIILVIALLVMAVVLYRKIKQLNADDSRYGQLTDDDSSKRRAAAAAQVTSAGPTGVAAPALAADVTDRGASSKLAAAVDANV